MKPRRKAQRIKARKIGEREPNGRLSRRAPHREARQRDTERSVMETAVQARQRIFGMTPEEARKQESGTVIGRMCQAGKLTVDQMRSAERYAEVRNAYQRAIGASPDTGHPPAEGEGHGNYEAFCNGARATHKAMMDALQALMIEQRSPAPVAALDHFIVRDIHVPELVGDLRLALNCLDRHFRQGARA